MLSVGIKEAPLVGSVKIHNDFDKKGFSLVELSIVLVILGLLTGGILTGQSLIRAAELRKITADNQQYQTAIYTFKSKYFALPGDMRNATQFWGAADGGDGFGVDCRDAVSSDETTCDGNGDGEIAYNSTTLSREQLRAWQHLANAGLVAGQYTGVFPSASPFYTAGQEVPAGPFSGSMWAFCHQEADAGYVRGNRLVLGSEGWSSPACNFGGSSGLTPEEGWSIDTKMDDGMAGSGKVRGMDSRAIGASSFSECAWAVFPFDAHVNTAYYVIDLNEPNCTMHFFW